MALIVLEYSYEGVVSKGRGSNEALIGCICVTTGSPFQSGQNRPEGQMVREILTTATESSVAVHTAVWESQSTGSKTEQSVAAQVQTTFVGFGEGIGHLLVSIT